MHPRLRAALPVLLLVLATLLWGLSFLVTRRGVAHVPPLLFVALRFAGAALTIGLIAKPGIARITRTELRAGGAIACAMLGGYSLQATGMLTVESGRTAFISALYVPIVPMLQLVLLRRMPALPVWIALFLACVGLMLLAGPQGGDAPRRGEALVLAGAFCTACEILLIGNFAPRCDPRRLAVTECATLSLLSLTLFGVMGQRWPAPAIDWILPALGLGMVSAFLQVSVNWAQRTVPAARATLIYALEPVWAGLAGALAGEHMGRLQVAGAALIVVALVIGTRRSLRSPPRLPGAAVAEE
jgi:drug/metabolite transporter (DMT)-like permease